MSDDSGIRKLRTIKAGLAVRGDGMHAKSVGVGPGRR
jgi:hypothetical protein